MTANLILIAISIGFWTLYNQTFSSLMLFADRNMDILACLALKLTQNLLNFLIHFP